MKRLYALAPALALSAFVRSVTAQPDALEVDASEPEPIDGAAGGGEQEPEARHSREAGDPLVVTVLDTSPARTAGSAHVIGEDELERFDRDDPHGVLLAAPGIYVRGEDGIGLRPNIGIRGVNSDRSKKVALLEDGVPLAPAPYSAPAAYYFPLITRMVAVRVIKGPSAISYGPQTIGGAIDLVTRRIPATGRGSIDVAGGSYGHRKVHAHYGSSDERTGFLVEGVHLGNDGYKELDGQSDVGTGFVRNEWMVKALRVLDPLAHVQHEFAAKLGYSDEASDETYTGLTDEDFRQNPDRRYRASALDRMEWRRTQAVLSHVVRFDETLDVTTTLYRHDFDRSWLKLNAFRGASIGDVLASPGGAQNAVFYGVLTGAEDSSSAAETLLIGPNRRVFVSQGAQVVVRWRSRAREVKHRLEWGIRFHHDSIDRRHTEDGFVMRGGNLTSDGLRTTTTADNDASAEAVSAHVAGVFEWGKVALTPGVRAEAIRSHMDDRVEGFRAAGLQQALLPGLGGFVLLTDDIGLLAGVHRGFSPAPPGQAARPELAWNYEGGVRFFRGQSRVEAIGFYSDYDNLTDVCTFSSGCLGANLDRQFDAGSARAYGVETFATHEIDAGRDFRVPLSAAYTWSRAEFTSSFTSADPQWGDVRSGYELPYIPRHQLVASAGAGTKRWLAAIRGRYTSAMRELAGTGDAPQSLSTDEQIEFDVTGHYRVVEPLRVHVEVKNLLDHRAIVSRRPYGARPNAPRFVTVGVEYEF